MLRDDGSRLANFRKRAMDTFGLWLVVYPTATVVIAIIGPYLSQLSLPMRTLVTSAVVVTLVANLTAPFGKWVVDRMARYGRAGSRGS